MGGVRAWTSAKRKTNDKWLGVSVDISTLEADRSCFSHFEQLLFQLLFRNQARVWLWRNGASNGALQESPPQENGLNRVDSV